MIRNPQFRDSLIRTCQFLILLFAAVTPLPAQSLDVGAPAPVRSNSLNGKIPARDLGDARLTDHYYAFTGTPGDLLITVQSRNLNGDLDVFTAVALRPLLKLSLYAESTAPITKGIYLRKREDLILRVEARSPNDDEGTYTLYFGGSFEPIAGAPDIAETETPETPKTETTIAGRKTKRVSSVGARIEEPEPPVTEVATAPTPEPTPEPLPEVKPVEPPESEKPVETEAPRPTPSRNARSRRSATRPPGARPGDTATGEETKPKEESGEVAEPETKPLAPSSSVRRRGASSRAVTKPPPEAEPEFGPRLVIETNDGTLINRSMSTVKRVTVENGQVVVTGRDGKIDRILLANVVRMSIAP